MSKTEIYLKKKAIKRLNEINSILEKYESNKSLNNKLLFETLKVLRKERRIILETKLRGYDYGLNNDKIKIDSENKQYNSKLIKLINYERGAEEKFSIDNSALKEYLIEILNLNEKYNPSKINNKIFKKIQSELEGILINYPSKYEIIKTRYLQLKNKYYYWLKNNESTILRTIKITPNNNFTSSKRNTNPKSESIFKTNLEKDKTIISYLKIEIESIESFVYKLDLNEKFGHIKLTSVKLEYNTKLNSIISKFNKLDIIEKNLFENKINNIQFVFESFINIQKDIISDNVSIIPLNTKSPYKVNNEKVIENIIFYWTDIIFRDNFITFWGYEKHSYPCKYSKTSYNKIKNFIVLEKKYKFKVQIDRQTNKMLYVSGLEAITEIFEQLEIKTSLDNYKIGDIEYFTTNILGKLTNHGVVNLFSLDKLNSQYLEYLCKKQDQNYKIIPVNENRTFNANTTQISEYVFLFTIKGNYQSIYIIWESIEISRATHIFKCTHDTYTQAIQKIYDYIQSPDITNKRQLLHNSSLVYFTGKVNYLDSNNHDYIIDWISRLNKMCF